VKRAFDILASACGGLVLLPIIALVAVLVATKLGFPILFRQRRPGRHGEPFTMVKFRTMRESWQKRNLIGTCWLNNGFHGSLRLPVDFRDIQSNALLKYTFFGETK
jgi:lipopolysaccharide/colanic/teichoic acid biosynthesis glycosyltransferase